MPFILRIPIIGHMKECCVSYLSTYYIYTYILKFLYACL